jgi:hypothetical protein
MRIVARLKATLALSAWGAAALLVAHSAEAAEAPSMARQAEIAFWNAISSSSNPADFENYLMHYPSGEYAGLAQRRLQSLKAPAGLGAPVAAAPAGPPDPFEMAVVGPPPAAPATPAATELRMLPAEGTFRVITNTYLRASPIKNSKIIESLKVGDDVSVTAKSSAADWYRAQARGSEGYVAAAALVETTALEETEWRRISARPSVATIGAFLKQFPDGRRTGEATALLELLNRAPSVAGKMTVDQEISTHTGDTGATMSRRCNSILERSQLGEPIADADRVFLSANCH